MAHRILGLDIGNRGIKLAIVDKTLRVAALTGWDEEPIPAGADDTVRSEALRRLLARNARPDDVLSTGLPAQLCLHRTLMFPFRDDKAIAEAVGFELENHIPTPLSDLIIGHVTLREKDGQSEVLAVAAPRGKVERQLEMLKGAGLDARRLNLNSLSYASLVRSLPDMATGTTMLVDIGTRTSEVVVLEDGRTQFLRSLSVGAEHIAELMAVHLPPPGGHVSLLLEEQGLLLSPGETPDTPEERERNDATAAAMAPLLRELRQTMAAWLRKSHTRPDRLLVTGGMTRLRGLLDYLEYNLGMAVMPVRLGDLAHVQVPNVAQLSETGALAVALALEAADARADQNVDFRQGELAYEGDFQVLRARLPQIAAFFVIALCLLGIRTSLTYRALLTEETQQFTQMQSVSKAVTGKTAHSFEELRKELGREPKVDMAGLYPDMSAFKVLEEISKIIDKVTEPPDFVPPGGPGDPGLPQVEARTPPDLGRMADPAMMGRQGFRGVPGLNGAPPIRGAVSQADDDAGDTSPSRHRRAIVPKVPTDPGSTLTPPPAGGRPGAAGAPGDAGEGGDKPEKDGPFTGHKIELSAMQIERNNATIRGDADSQDALLALQQAIDAHRCFGKAKSSADRITFERHRDWFKFTIQFEIACPQADAVPAKGKKGDKGDADGAKAGKAKADEASDEEE